MIPLTSEYQAKCIDVLIMLMRLGVIENDGLVDMRPLNFLLGKVDEEL